MKEDTFVVTHDSDGRYIIRINGSRKKYFAYTTAEVKTALEHYSHGGTFYGGSHYLLDNPRCPLCRAIKEDKIVSKTY